MKISKEIQSKLICPSTKSKLIENGNYLESSVNHNLRYPMVDGIPVLIDNNRSIFSIEDFIDRRNTTFDLDEFTPGKKTLKKIVEKIIPSININLKAAENYSRIIEMLPNSSKILVIGGSIKGKGMDELYANKSFEIIGSDVSFGPETNIINDAHDLPFDNQTFDCVIIQAVLEHVLEPQRCVDEIYRVLKASGLVYAETPFMQQVHMKQYDFTRFTHLGHRWIFKNFDEINSGPICGPGMALAWSYSYFLTSFTTSRPIHRFLTVFARLTSFFLKYFDYYLIDKPGSYDAASGYFFLGKKSNYCLSDRELIMMFKGVT